MGKVNNFQEEFSLHDIEIAKAVSATHDCGMSRIALKAPDQVYRVHRSLMKEPRSRSALVVATTLKLHYATQVWCKAALISAENPSDLLYYWWLRWENDGTPFKKLKYSNFYRDITVEQLLCWFWELLEKIANSGEVQVSEGYYIDCEGEGYTGPKVTCTLVLDADSGREIHDKVENIYTYAYNKEKKTYKWEEIKDLFYEMTLDQLRLTNHNKLHNHSGLDDTLLMACSKWDVEQIKLSLERGANINCLDDNGESVLQRAVEYYKDHGVIIDKDYSEEELKAIEVENEKKCKEVVELLLSYGADINLFGYDGMAPIVCAYYMQGTGMIKFLLEKGADPNVNCYLEDYQYWTWLKNVRSTILDVISECPSDDYTETVQEIERIVREAGGRQFVYDFTPWSYENVGKYVVYIVPSATDDGKMFWDNSGWKIGSFEQITIEDAEGRQTTIKIEGGEGLKQWNEDFLANRTNLHYDWQSWKERGYNIALRVAISLPDSVALYYLYDNDEVVDNYPNDEKVYLSRKGERIRIK